VRLMHWVEQGLFLFRVHLLLHQQLNLMNYIFFEELALVQNGGKIHARQCCLMNMFKMKDVAIINATSQIYKLHGFVPNLLFHGSVLFTHKCHALFKHGCSLHDFHV
jgi:hypothetical protein